MPKCARCSQTYSLTHVRKCHVRPKAPRAVPEEDSPQMIYARAVKSLDAHVNNCTACEAARACGEYNRLYSAERAAIKRVGVIQ